MLKNKLKDFFVSIKELEVENIMGCLLMIVCVVMIILYVSTIIRG